MVWRYTQDGVRRLALQVNFYGIYNFSLSGIVVFTGILDYVPLAFGGDALATEPGGSQRIPEGGGLNDFFHGA
tara:strand:- start:3058 stop:3276 length:219 start_codon:yes stop_codon:yes gene_type:complete